MPLANARHEAFVQLVAGGLNGRAAWSEAAGGPVAADSAKVQAYRLNQRPDVAARIAYLRRERAATPEDVAVLDTPERVAEALAECVSSLETAHDLGTAAAVSGGDLGRLRVTLGLIAGRLFKVRPPRIEGAAPPAGAALDVRALPPCSCARPT